MQYLKDRQDNKRNKYCVNTLKIEEFFNLMLSKSCNSTNNAVKSKEEHCV